MIITICKIALINMYKGIIMLTRKYYKMIARVIKNNICEDNYMSANCLINDLSIEFKKDNNLFNGDTFKEACNITYNNKRGK